MPLSKDIINQLQDIVGDEYCKTTNAEIYVYVFDGGIHRRKPDVVVQPQNTQQVQKIVRLANKYKIPIVSRGAGSALCGHMFQSTVVSRLICNE